MIPSREQGSTQSYKQIYINAYFYTRGENLRRYDEKMEVEGRTTRRILLRLLAFAPDRVGKIFARRPSESRYSKPNHLLQAFKHLAPTRLFEGLNAAE